MGKSAGCEVSRLKRGAWKPEEDKKLLDYIQQHGCGKWRTLPQKAGLKRCGKSCRLRWINYLRPDIKRGKFSVQEDRTIVQLHALLGNRWSAIAAHLPKRTDNEIKNYWNTHLKKRLAMMGIDPITHKLKTTTLSFPNGDPKKASNLSHMAQWETARLQAEARLVRISKMQHHNGGGGGGGDGGFGGGGEIECASGLLELNQFEPAGSGFLGDCEKQNQESSAGKMDSNGGSVFGEVFDDQENKYYWELMLNWVNCGHLDSPVF